MSRAGKIVGLDDDWLTQFQRFPVVPCVDCQHEVVPASRPVCSDCRGERMRSGYRVDEFDREFPSVRVSVPERLSGHDRFRRVLRDAAKDKGVEPVTGGVHLGVTATGVGDLIEGQEALRIVRSVLHGVFMNRYSTVLSSRASVSVSGEPRVDVYVRRLLPSETSGIAGVAAIRD